MGEMADYYADDYASEFEHAYWFYQQQEPAWLAKHCATSRKPIILGIRDYFAVYGRMSAKQRNVLAFYLAQWEQED